MNRLTGAVAVLAILIALAGPVRAEMPESDELLGVWSFDGTCASGWGMGLSANGEVWFAEWGQGLWVVDRDAILMLLRAGEMGDSDGPTVSVIVLRIDDYQGDRFSGILIDSGQHDIEATRCS